MMSNLAMTGIKDVKIWDDTKQALALCDGSKEVARKWTNLATNPSFETTSGTVEVRRNYAYNPLGESSGSWLGNGGVGAAPTWVTDFPGPVTTAARFTTTTTGAANAGVYLGGVPASSVVSGRMRVRVAGGTLSGVTINHRPTAVTSSSGETILATIGTVDDGVYEFTFTAITVSSTATVTGTGGVSIRWGSASAIDITIDITNVVFEVASVAGSCFTGTQRPAVRTNLFTNPALAYGTSTRWGSYAGASGSATSGVQTSGGVIGANFFRLTWTVATSTASGGPYMGNATNQCALVFPSQVITGSVYVRPSKTQIFRAGFDFRNEAGTAVGSVIYGSEISCPANVWTRISIVGTTVPATATRARLLAYVGPSGTAWQIGDTVDADAGLVEVSATLQDYFDGSTTPPTGFGVGWRGTTNLSESYMYDGDFTPSWIGTTNASASILTALGVAKADTGNNTQRVDAESGHWAMSGSKSMRIVPVRGNDGAAGIIIAGSAGTLLLVDGKTYTMMATIRSTVDTMSTQPYARAMYIQAPTTVLAKAPAEAGVFTLQAIFTYIAGTDLRLGGDKVDVWWDNLVIVEGNYTGGYFDGTNIPNDEAYGIPSWAGSANDSASSVWGPPDSTKA